MIPEARPWLRPALVLLAVSIVVLAGILAVGAMNSRPLVIVHCPVPDANGSMPALAPSFCRP